MRLPRRRFIRFTLFAVAGVVFAAGACGGIYWARYPKVPDITKTPLDEAMHFAATDDFNRMAEWHRKRYLLALANRMHEKSFADLMAMMMMGDADRKKQMENEKLLSEADRKEVQAAYFRLMLDKFFEMSKAQRSTFLMMAALAEKAGSSHHRAGQPTGLPTPQQIQKGMSDFLSQQPPHTAAQVDEAMSEWNQKRQMMGIKDPWG